MIHSLAIAIASFINVFIVILLGSLKKQYLLLPEPNKKAFKTLVYILVVMYVNLYFLILFG